MNYDIIGDIHGNAGKLKRLLGTMGYEQRRGSWRKPGHQAIFVGDFIDRGKEQIETVEIVRAMVDSGSAHATMGNHEFNAVAWFTPDPDSPGEYLRPHQGPLGVKNRHQHQDFLDEVEGTARHREIIEWFMTLPLWLELSELRVIHACWHQRHLDFLEPLLVDRKLGTCMVVAASRRERKEFIAVECLLKGLEIKLPEGVTFEDKDGHARSNVRLRWWDPLATTYRRAAILGDMRKEEELPDVPIPLDARVEYRDTKPVFFGHYWMTGAPAPQTAKCACVDYSAGKGGPLVAYRWQGEAELLGAHFVQSM